jgi:hypothetical protein
MKETGTRSSNSSAGVYRFNILIIYKRNETQIKNDYFNLSLSFHTAYIVFEEYFHIMDKYQHSIYNNPSADQKGCHLV